jgi:hypothetical protein
LRRKIRDHTVHITPTSIASTILAEYESSADFAEPPPHHDETHTIPWPRDRSLDQRFRDESVPELDENKRPG